MKSIGASEARRRFSKVLERVSRGEKITITRHGVPAALLVPATEAAPKLAHQKVVAGMRALRKQVKPGKTSVRDMVKESRQF